jgi:hypothetical protein
VTAITPQCDRPRYRDFGRGDWSVEVTMTVMIRKTQLRLVRWFKKFATKNPSPYRWYECDGYGVG